MKIKITEAAPPMQIGDLVRVINDSSRYYKREGFISRDFTTGPGANNATMVEGVVNLSFDARWCVDFSDGDGGDYFRGQDLLVVLHAPVFYGPVQPEPQEVDDDDLEDAEDDDDLEDAIADTIENAIELELMERLNDTPLVRAILRTVMPDIVDLANTVKITTEEESP